MARKVLIVEDEANIAELLHLYLEKEGFETTVASDGGKGVELFRSFVPDLVLLDIMLPVLDGWGVLRKIREAGNTPVIMLTAKGTEYDKVIGLDAGADDYIAKPFGIMELMARIRAALRHSATPPQGKREYTFGPLYLNSLLHKVTVSGREITLTLKEFQVLELLMEHQDAVLTREQLLNTVWGYEFDGASRTVDVHIRTLRQKLEEAGALIETVRGLGYRLSSNPSQGA